jgi:sporulation protein YlmC with PRC-barrel domain
MEYHEAHVEYLLGRQVRDIDGDVVGRLEELHVEMIDGEYVVTEYHVGPAALLERVGRLVTQLPFFRYIPFAQKGYRVPWTQFTLSDPRDLRVTVPRGDLTPMQLSD